MRVLWAQEAVASGVAQRCEHGREPGTSWHRTHRMSSLAEICRHVRTEAATTFEKMGDLTLKCTSSHLSISIVNPRRRDKVGSRTHQVSVATRIIVSLTRAHAQARREHFLRQRPDEVSIWEITTL